MSESPPPSAPVPVNSWTGLPCRHDGDDLGRYEADVCHGCGTVVSQNAPTDG